MPGSEIAFREPTPWFWAVGRIKVDWQVEAGMFQTIHLRDC